MATFRNPDPVFEESDYIWPEIFGARKGKESVRSSMSLRYVVVDPVIFIGSERIRPSSTISFVLSGGDPKKKK